MRIIQALEKIDTLTKCELEHCIQRLDEEIKYYQICVKNYNKEKMEKYGIPYRKMLEEKRQKFVDKLNLL